MKQSKKYCLNNRIITRLLKEYAKTNRYEIVFHSNGWVIELQKNNQSKFIYGYNFWHNDPTVVKICEDKSALSEILTKNNIPNIKHFYFMNPKNQHCSAVSWSNIFVKLLKKHKKLVFKPNNGTGGDYLFLINNEKQLKNAAQKIFNRFDALTISPYATIQNEYRLIIFKKITLLVYEKIKSNNEWRHNLQLGAIPKIINDNKLLCKLNAIVDNVRQHLDIKLGAIDIVSVKNKLYVLEINPGIMLEKFAKYSKQNYNIAKKIYWKIMKEN